MKPVYLEFCGVNSFSEKAVIDFRKLLSGGVFGIFGDTGSGKSTILDCIHIALYGKLERSSETDCINHKCDGFSIVFEFETVLQGVRRTYRVERSRNRKKKVEAKLYERVEDGKLVAVADGVTEVNEAVLDIVGLKYEDFKMCIALPQGEFAGLIKARPKDRLSLVARLFDLGRFGDRLNIVIRAKVKDADNEVTIFSGLMEGAEDCSAERLSEAAARLAALQTAQSEAQKTFAEAGKRLAALETLYTESKEYEETAAALAKLEAGRTAFEARKAAIEKLPLAKRYQERALAVAAARKGIAEATRQMEELSRKLAEAERRLGELQTKFANENYDERIAALNKALGQLQAAQADLAARDDALKRLRTAQAEYQTLKRALEEKKEDFDGQLAAIDERLAKLGEDEGLSGFVKRHFGQEVKNEVYGQVRTDLYALLGKHPSAAADIGELLEKYVPVSGGEAFDFIKAKAAYEALETERERLKRQREGVLAKKQAYELEVKRMELLLEKGKHCREEYEAAVKKLEEIEKLGTLDGVTAQLKRTQQERALADKAVKDTQESVNEIKAAWQKAKGAKDVYEDTLAAESEAFAAVAQESGFADLAEAEALILAVGGEGAAAEVEAFFREYERLTEKKAQGEARGANRFSMEEYERAKAAKLAAEETNKELLVELGKETNALKTMRENAEKYAATEQKLKQAQKRKQEWEKLLKLLTANRSGKTLMEFVASEYLQEICGAATVTLLQLTGGRYFLRYDTEFFVGDNLDGGKLRLVSTLSGGETFLVSLSLALSLSAAICQKSMRPAEFFFLDEGFGTLDRALVDTVMDVLGKVSTQFSVGLISHVEELKLRIENKIEVTAADKMHGSLVRVVAY